MIGARGAERRQSFERIRIDEFEHFRRVGEMACLVFIARDAPAVSSRANGVEHRESDAVDIDGRVYQLTRLPGPEQPAVVAVDGEPHPDDTPATHPGLTALITATRDLIHTVYRRPRP